MLTGTLSPRVSWSRLAVFVTAAFLVSGFFAPNAQATVGNINITSPVAGVPWRGNQTISWTATGASEDQIYIYYSTDGFVSSGEKIVGPIPYTAVGNQAWDTTALSGSTFSVKITDSSAPWAGGTSAGTFTIDNTPPTTTSMVNPVSPNGDNGWYKTKPIITLTCSDTLSGCGHTFYRWGSTGSYTDGDSAPVSLSDGAVPEGDNTLYYYSEDQAVDNADAHNVETAKTLNVKVDTAAPTASYTLDGHTANAVFNPTAPDVVTITITANEDVKFTTIRIQDGTSTTVKDFDRLSYSTTVTKVWDGTGNTGDGVYTVKPRMIDRAGNVADETLTPYSITVDTHSPAVDSVTAPTDIVYTSEDPPLEFTVHDVALGTALTCSYSIDDVDRPGFPCTGSVSTTITGLSEGRHEVIVKVTDAAGNSDSYDPISFVYSSDPILTVCASGADFTTIQAAVTAAATGNTISICAGIYNESVLVGKQLTLLGSGAKPVVRGSAGTDYILKVNGVNGVVLDNLEINGGSSNNFDYGILVNSSGTDLSPVEIKNSTVKNVWRNGAKGIGAENSSYVSVHNNTISSFHKSGIRFVASGGKFYVNEVIGDNVDGTSRVQNLVNMWTGSNVEVYENDLHNALTTPGIVPTWDSVAVFVSSYYSGYPDSGSSQANVHDNDIYDSDSGVVVGSYYSAVDNSSATITDNTFHNLNWAINFEKGTISATITGNKFSAVDKAVSANDGFGGPATKPSVNAERNWWGTAYRPTIVGLVYPEVDFDPYWANEAMTILSTDSVGTVYVDAAYTDGAAGSHIYGYDAFSTVQKGVEKVAASGTVNVADGTYTENVNVNKALTLQGEGTVASIIINGLVTVGSENVTVQNLTLTNPTGNYAVSIGGFGNVTITGNTVTDVGTSASGNVHAIDWQDTALDATNLTITHNTISNIGNTTTAGSTSGIGILDSTGAAILTTVLIDDNTISDIRARAGKGAYGVILNHADDSTTGAVSNATISNNTISALTGGWATAIGLEGNTPNATVEHNIISGLSSGANLGVHIEDNGFADTVTILHNQFNFGTPGVGVYNSMTDPANATENWWNSETGPTHVSNPGGAGTAVSDNVDYSPWCLTSACTAPFFGSSDPLNHYHIDPSAASSVVGVPITLTITAKDAADITRINDTSSVTMSADAGASLGAIIVAIAGGGADGSNTTTVNNSVTGPVNIAAIQVGGTATGASSVTFTSSDVGAPMVLGHTPADGSTNVSATVDPTITFSEPLASGTVTSANIQLRAYGTDTAVPAIVSLVEGGTTVVITPNANLANETQYYFAVSAAVTDLTGNPLSTVLDAATKDSNEFTTVAIEPFIVDDIVPRSSTAEPNNTYVDGWHYTYYLTINATDETELFVMFENWLNTTDGVSTIPANGNMRVLFNHTTGGGLGSIVGSLSESDITGGFGNVDSYEIGSALADQKLGGIASGIETGILDTGSASGRQIQFDVFTKIPASTVAGAYEADYTLQLGH